MHHTTCPVLQRVADGDEPSWTRPEECLTADEARAHLALFSSPRICLECTGPWPTY
ncbi:hypothetical protein ACWD2L_00675 [Streptomyces sp. NPDC002754]